MAVRAAAGRRAGRYLRPVEPFDPDQRALSVEVAAVRWRAPDGAFAVLAGVTDDGEEVVLVGALDHVHEGESVDVEGAWQRHAKHGWRFVAQRTRVQEPASEQALLAYLGSVKHVGPRGAAWLLERHGPADVLAAIDRDPQRTLHEVPGIGRARIGPAVRSWEDQGALRAVRLFLEEHGVPAAVAARIYRAYGADAIDALRTDPYGLTDLDGIGFATADALAQALGTPPDSPGRLDAGLRHALREAEVDGHCHLPRAELAERARRLLGADPEDRIDDLAARGRLVVEDGRVFHPAMHAIERRLAGHVRALIEDEPRLRLREPARPTGGFVPTDDQWAVVQAVLDRRLAILTGGPGTGKTAVMRVLVDLLQSERRTVRLCAPTGKAARRLSELTGAPATTIHRLLEWSPQPPAGFTRGPEDPIPGTDVLVVDEASMLSVTLAEALLGAVGPRTHVLLVGDVDQLAPVGPGRVLDDLIASGRVPVVRLTEVFRQAARSLIVRAAHAINRGERPPAAAGPDDVRDFFLVERAGAEAIRDEVVSLAAERLPAHYDLDPRAGVLVVAPMHRGPAGIDELNARLRARLNPDGPAIGGTSLRVGDRVLQTRNNHERELMNGEMGVLEHHDDERDRVLMACDDGRRLTLPVAELDTMRLGHAVSVHKAQGSQAPAVVVVLHRGHHLMLTRNLAYTAVTRAERVCVVVGEQAALAAALGRRDAHARHTRLAELVAL
ncbi:MAG: exodeoxyribonuclease alpha subunit [Solirubrobacteraceae bacterium]|nr:exodeoxyribonuclease alpha subunit [Solirubrobacteraceae bacterium]